MSDRLERVEHVAEAIREKVVSMDGEVALGTGRWYRAVALAAMNALDALDAMYAEPRRLTATEVTLLLFAMRYSLGRMSMAPSIVDTYIREHMDSLSVVERRRIAHEIDEYEAWHILGMDCDVARWHALRDALREVVDDE